MKKGINNHKQATNSLLTYLNDSQWSIPTWIIILMQPREKWRAVSLKSSSLFIRGNLCDLLFLLALESLGNWALNKPRILSKITLVHWQLQKTVLKPRQRHLWSFLYHSHTYLHFLKMRCASCCDMYVFLNTDKFSVASVQKWLSNFDVFN
jgi:hypothetical protein